MDDHAQANTLSERADALEEHMMHELEHIVIKSALFNLADGKLDDDTAAVLARNPGKYLIMKEDPRLPKMPAKPTLIDYFKCRFASTAHLLQSAAHAKKAGHGEKVIMACLLHDIAVASFIRCDHGYWGAQMIEPYVDEEISWAVRAHQALRFFPDESVGYQYPGSLHQMVRSGFSGRALYRRRVQARPRPQALHDGAPDHPQRPLFIRSRRQGRP